MIILKYICLGFAITYTFSNVAKVFRGHRISNWQMMIMGFSLAGYIML